MLYTICDVVITFTITVSLLFTSKTINIIRIVIGTNSTSDKHSCKILKHASISNEEQGLNLHLYGPFMLKENRMKYEIFGLYTYFIYIPWKLQVI